MTRKLFVRCFIRACLLENDTSMLMDTALWVCAGSYGQTNTVFTFMTNCGWQVTACHHRSHCIIAHNTNNLRSSMHRLQNSHGRPAPRATPHAAHPSKRVINMATAAVNTAEAPAAVTFNRPTLLDMPVSNHGARVL